MRRSAEIADQQTKKAAFDLGRQVSSVKESAESGKLREAFEAGLPLVLTVDMATLLLNYYLLTHQQLFARAMAEAMRAEREAARARQQTGPGSGQRTDDRESRLYSPPSMDPYESLGLARDATDAEVKRTYLGLAKQFHPDAIDTAGMNTEEVELADIQFKIWTNSYNSIRAERALRRAERG